MITFETILESLRDPTLQTVAGGTALLGIIAGMAGSFAVIRRESLQGDAVAHAALPGVAIAFLLGARSPILMVLGGAIAGWFALTLVASIVRNSPIPFDAALAGALSGFFGLGLALMSKIRTAIPGATEHGLERYLFGQAATMVHDDLRVIAVVGIAMAGLMLLFWKWLALVSFDAVFAASLGIPVRFVTLLLVTMVVVATVVGLQAVGVVLMSALIVAPAVAARQWTDRLHRVVLLSGVMGGLAGLVGSAASAMAKVNGRSIPTGPAIVLVVTALVLLSMLVAPRHGLIRRLLPRRPETA